MRHLLESLCLLLARSMVREFVADYGSCMGYESSDDVFLEFQCEIEIRPRLVPVLKRRHAEDKIMQVFEVAITLALVTQTDDETVELDMCQCHIV